MSTTPTDTDRQHDTRPVLDVLRRLNIAHGTDADLASLTWYKVGGRADVLAHPTNAEQLCELVACCAAHGVSLRVLGSGANLLVGDQGVPGLVVRFDAGALAGVEVRDNGTVVAAAGFDLMRLVSLTAGKGLDGLQGLAGVPASVGGAVRMNAGGRYCDTGQTITRVRVVSSDGRLHDLPRRDIEFAYRHTSIAADAIVVEAEFALQHGDSDVLRKRVLEIMGDKKASQPLGAKSAGCTWKNPTPPRRYLSDDAPRPADGDPHGWPAGMLVDRAGLKNFAVGGARISDRHANFIACDPHATATDVLSVMRHAEQVVLERFGVTLQREVVVWCAG